MTVLVLGDVVWQTMHWGRRVFSACCCHCHFNSSLCMHACMDVWMDAPCEIGFWHVWRISKAARLPSTLHAEIEPTSGAPATYHSVTSQHTKWLSRVYARASSAWYDMSHASCSTMPHAADEMLMGQARHTSRAMRWVSMHAHIGS